MNKLFNDFAEKLYALDGKIILSKLEFNSNGKYGPQLYIELSIINSVNVYKISVTLYESIDIDRKIKDVERIIALLETF